MLDCSDTMHTGMTFSTARDQILAAIATGVTTKVFVVNLKIGHCAARLASPTIATQHLIASLIYSPASSRRRRCFGWT
jgi:hypothetical protein